MKVCDVLIVVLAVMAVVAIWNRMKPLDSEFIGSLILLKEVDGKQRAEINRTALRTALWSLCGGAVNSALMGFVVSRIWSWRHYPNGTLVKLIWNVLVLAFIALVLYVLLSYLDRWINRSSITVPNYRETGGKSSVERYGASGGSPVWEPPAGGTAASRPTDWR